MYLLHGAYSVINQVARGLQSQLVWYMTYLLRVIGSTQKLNYNCLPLMQFLYPWKTCRNMFISITHWDFPKTKIYHINSFIADHSFFMFCSDLVDPDRQREMRPQTMDISAYSCPDVPHNYHVYALPTCYSIDEMTNYRDIYEWWIRDIQLWSWKLYQLKPRSWRPIDPSILIILWVCVFYRTQTQEAAGSERSLIFLNS